MTGYQVPFNHMTLMRIQANRLTLFDLVPNGSVGKLVKIMACHLLCESALTDHQLDNKIIHYRNRVKARVLSFIMKSSWSYCLQVATILFLGKLS